MTNGKNVEPEPIEGALCVSHLIKHVVLLGQDKRELVRRRKGRGEKNQDVLFCWVR
jgi:hypothetical protein